MKNDKSDLSSEGTNEEGLGKVGTEESQDLFHTNIMRSLGEIGEHIAGEMEKINKD